MEKECVSLGADERLDEVNEGLRLIQKKNGLTYGTDAYLLAAYVSPAPQATCVDLGSGSGIISLLLAQRNRVARVVGVEVQPPFAALIERNAALNGLERIVCSVCADVREMTQLRLGTVLGMSEGKAVDIVVCNPPYMRVDSGYRNEHDEKFLARHEVCGDVGDFCAAAARLLRFGGRFYIVFRPDRMTDLMVALRANRLEPKRLTMVHADEASAPCMVLVEARLGGAPLLQMTPPLMLHKAESRALPHRPFTKVAQVIYDTMSFDACLVSNERED